MEGSHHVNWNGIIYRKAAIQRSEIERPFLAAKSFNINLVQYLNFYRSIMLLLVMCMSTLYVHGREPKTILDARNLVHEKL